MTDLLIVARNQRGLYDYLRQDFSDDDGVEVIVDRRRGERRRGPAPVDGDRRQHDRRAAPDLREKFASVGFAVVRTS